MILAKTGPRDLLIPTPSACSYILPLKKKDVFWQVSKINFFKELFVCIVVISLPYKCVLK